MNAVILSFDPNENQSVTDFARENSLANYETYGSSRIR